MSHYCHLFCFFRYIAIVHALRAHLLCSRKRVLISVASIWPMALLLASPTALFNTTKMDTEVTLCLLGLPKEHTFYRYAYKYTEFVLFYLGPILVQVYLYSVISKQLFIGNERLHRQSACRHTPHRQPDDHPDTIRSRKGVIKMLITCVIIYVISFTPIQVQLIYDSVSSKRLEASFAFIVFVMTMGYINSAANPILYCIFSHNFRRKYRKTLSCNSCSSSDSDRTLYHLRHDQSSARAFNRTTVTTKCSYGHPTANNNDLQ